VLGRQARWQDLAATPLHLLIRRVGWQDHFEMLSLVEVLLRRSLGQPLSVRAWDRMTYSDKIVYQRLLNRDPQLAVFCDKLEMRELVMKRLGPDAVPQLLRVGASAAQISDLAGPYVLKANHGCGWVMLVEADGLTEEQATTADAWLRKNYAYRCLERGYLGARPLLLAEERLPGGATYTVPPDYRLYTFGGKVVRIAVEVSRFQGDRTRIARFNPDWTPDLARADEEAPEEPVPAPPNLATMLEWAAVLAKGIDFVRVDLYDLGDRVLVGELTPYPGAGMGRIRPRGIDVAWGRLWRSPPQASQALASSRSLR